MGKYAVLLFDLDDTLLDFHGAERQALAALFAALGEHLDEGVEGRYRDLNAALWKDYERGRISREALCDSRFALLFAQLGKEVDGVAAEKIYRRALDKAAPLVEGAAALCAALAADYPLYAVTNGAASTQRSRLAIAGLDRYFQELFISQEIGHPKPERAFFDWVFRALPQYDPRQMLIIGDSLSSDIQGGVNAGVDTCWFNPRSAALPDGPRPTYQIRRLADLPDLLARA